METETKKRGGILRWFAVLMAIFIAAGTVFGMTQMGGDSPVYAAEGTWIYVDGANGNDSYDGSSAGGAVKSWEKAKSLLGNKEGGIYVSGTVQATGNINTENSGKQSVKRADGFTGVMFEVPNGETATFYNIDVDGEDKRIDAEVIKPNSNSTLNFLSGAVFHDIGYLEGASANETDVLGVNGGGGPGRGYPDNATGGRVCSLAEYTNILIDGATFRDNDGKGVFFTPLTGGTGGGVTNVYLTMTSGVVTGNKGYFYHNEVNDTSSNIITIYNALIRNNDASRVAERYSSYQGRTAAVYVCDMGIQKYYPLSGAAVFDNAEYDVMQAYRDSGQGAGLKFKDETQDQDYSRVMLGGGNPNWGGLTPVADSKYPDAYFAYKSNPSQADKDAAVAAATSVFENNQSTVIDSNGTVIFGRRSNDPEPPETPEIPDGPTPGTEEEEEEEEPEPQTEEPTTPVVPEKNETTDESPEAKAQIIATKTLEGRELKANEFTFELYAADEEGNIISETAIDTQKNDAEGKVTFKEIEYVKAGTYNYIVKEVIPEEKEEGMTYDDNNGGKGKLVTVTVTERNSNSGKNTNNNYTVSDKPHYVDLSSAYPNTPTATIGVRKTLEGDRAIKEGEFEFELWNYDNTQLIATASNDAEGFATFKLGGYSLQADYEIANGYADRGYYVKEVVNKNNTDIEYDSAATTGKHIVITITDTSKVNNDVSGLIGEQNYVYNSPQKISGGEVTYCVNKGRAYGSESGNRFKYAVSANDLSALQAALNKNATEMGGSRARDEYEYVTANEELLNRLKAVLYYGYPNNGAGDNFTYDETQNAIYKLIYFGKDGAPSYSGAIHNDNGLLAKAKSQGLPANVTGQVFVHRGQKDSAQDLVSATFKTKEVTSGSLVVTSKDTEFVNRYKGEPEEVALTATATTVSFTNTYEENTTRPEITNTTANAGGVSADEENAAEYTLQEGETEVVLSDTIKFTNLDASKTYEIRAMAYDANGNEVRNKPATVSGQTEGEVTISFNRKVGEGTYNIKATIKDTATGETVAEHNVDYSDISERAIVKKAPEITSTTANVGGNAATSEKAAEYTLSANETETQLSDTIVFKNLDASKTYEIRAMAYDANGNEVRNKPATVSGKTEGEVTISFDRKVGEGTYKIKATIKDTATGEIVAEHNDDLKETSETAIVDKIYKAPGVETDANGAEGNTIAPAEGQSIVDNVTLTDLVEGVDYKLTGKLMIQDGSANGTEVTKYDCKEVNLTAEDIANGTAKVTFTNIDASELAGKTLVVFETLSWTSDKHGDTKEVKHEDINDDAQSVAVDQPGSVNVKITGKKGFKDSSGNAVNSPVSNLTDMFQFGIYDENDQLIKTTGNQGFRKTTSDGSIYAGFDFKYTEAGTYTYTIKENKEYKKNDADYTGISIDAPDQTVIVKVVKDGSNLKIDSVTGGENNNGVITVSFTGENGNTYEAPKADRPTVATKAETTDGNNLKPEAGQTVKDTVKLTNLVQGTEYTITGELHIKAGDNDGGMVETYTCEPVVFTAEADGDAEKIMTFTGIDASNLGDKDLVVFETLTWTADVHEGDDKNEEHHNINDAEQTVHVDKPAPTPVQVKVSASKTVDGDASKVKKDAFKFVIYGEDGNAVLAAGGNGDGSRIVKAGGSLYQPFILPGANEYYTEAGTYTYTIKEDATYKTDETLDYDVTEKQVKVVVTLNEETNAFEAKVNETAVANGGTFDAGVFNNTTKPKNEAAPTAVVIKTKKTLEGKALEADEFTFALNGSGQKQTANNKADGEVEFNEIKYIAAGEYTYTISENKGSKPGMTYDTSDKTVKVKVTLNEETNALEIAEVTGGTLAGGVITVEGEGFANTYTQPEQPSIGTTATDGADGDKTVVAETEAKVVDVVEYVALKPNTKYTVTGTLMNKKTGKEFKVDGKAVTKTAEFTTDATGCGTVELEFVFDASALKTGDSLVAFEAVSDENGEVAVHKDLNDPAQTVDVVTPDARTTATDNSDGDKILGVAGETEVKDVVKYTNLTPGKTYTLEGKLVTKSSNGKTVVATKETTFTPAAADGETELTFKVNTLELTGEKLVAFETVKYEGKEVVVHANINDGDQTVEVETPEIKTTATDAADGDSKVTAEAKAKVKDVVEYKNLIPGKKYTMSGELVKKSDKTVVATAKKDFTADDSGSGKVTLTFTFDASDLAGESAVAFETAKDGDDVIAVHADINDRDQTVEIEKPDARTTATDNTDGDKILDVEATAQVKDIVKYTKLTKGKTYTLTGKLVTKSSNGKTVVATQTTTFTPSAADGEVELVFDVDTTKFAGEKLVAFETVSFEGMEVVVHADINDADQTVEVKKPEIATTATDKADGDKKVTAGSKAQVVDVVKYSNLKPGKQYTMSGELVKKSDKKVIAKASKKFNASKDGSGTVTLTFTFDASKLAGESAVAFETAKEGNVVIATHADLNDADQTVEIVEPEKYNGEIRTTVEAGGKKGSEDAEAKLTAQEAAKVTYVTDTIDYTGLVKGDSYKVTGTLMKIESDKETAVKTVTDTKVAEDVNGQWTITFTGVTLESDAKYVVYEEAVNTDTKKAEAGDTHEHKDKNDKAQTVVVDKPETVEYNGEIRTTVEAGGKKGSEDAEANLTAQEAAKVTYVTDTIDYTGLVKGDSYKVTGTLMKIESDKETAVKTVTETKVAEDVNGQWTITFTGVTLESDSKYVVYEEAVNTDTKKAEAGDTHEHKDKNDKAQTVVVDKPETVEYNGEIRTTVEAGGKKGSEDAEANLTAQEAAKVNYVTDTIDYTGLVKGDSYKVTGTLMKIESDKETVVKTVTETKVAEDVNGQWTITFTGVTLESDAKYVVYEEAVNTDAKKAEAGDTHEHKNKEDKAQTVVVEKPEETPETPEIKIATKAELGAKSAITEDGTTTGVITQILDTVSYEGLETGKTYKLVGKLMDKATQNEVDAKYYICSATEVKPTAAKGTALMIFDLTKEGARALSGREIVVYEKLFEVKVNDDNTTTEEEVAKHEDITDKNQTVKVPEKENPTVEISKTAVADSAELPGAKLVITKKGSDEVLYQHTSTNQTWKVKLAPGEYTLTEITAPKGYEVAESIDFTVDENGLVGSKKVHMEDAPTPEEPKPEITEVTVTKKWNDADNQDGVRPANITVNLLADGAQAAKAVLNTSNNWTHTFTKLPKKNEAGADIVYTVVEANVPAGYEASVDGTIITNTHAPETVTVSGTKTWNDADNQDGKRPVSVKINLLKNGEKIQSKTVTEKDNWTYTWTGLAKYENGNEIKYTVTEDKVAGYQATISGYDVTNNYTPGKTSVSVVKAWADENDKDAIRPASVSATLYADGASVDTQVLSADNGWTYTWTDLDEMKGGKTIVYTVDEAVVPEGYGKAVTENNGTFVITNTHTPSKEEKENPTVTISKTDAATSAELPGATLVIKDASGEDVVTFVSKSEPTEFKLAPGEYTLTEITAPQGYEVAETIAFTVDENGLVGSDKVEMKDAPIVEEENPTVTISKTDAATTAELPGATLIIRNAEGKIVESFVSGSEPTLVQLAPGEYTLTELTAPQGYQVAETISFTVDANGLVGSDKVEMKDAPIVEEEKEGKLATTVHANGTVASNAAAAQIDLQAKDGAVNVVDYIVYTDLKGGVTYAVTGQLMKIVDGKAVEVVAERTYDYTADASGNGEWVMVIGDVTVEQDTKYVVFETAVEKNVAEGETPETIEHKDANDTAQTVVVKPYVEGTEVEISKQDATTKEELPGAQLIVKNTAGDVVAEWTSGTTPHKITLKPGNYTLTEITAPNGYLKAETIAFTVDESGLVGSDKVVMLDAREDLQNVKNTTGADITAEKFWTTEWPEGVSVTFTLQYYDGGEWKTYYKEDGTTYTVTIAEGEVAVFENVPVQINGATAKYRVVEDAVDGYNVKEWKATDFDNLDGTMSVTNQPNGGKQQTTPGESTDKEQTTNNETPSSETGEEIPQNNNNDNNNNDKNNNSGGDNNTGVITPTPGRTTSGGYPTTPVTTRRTGTYATSTPSVSSSTATSTGDTNNAALWIVLAAAASAAIAGAAFGISRRRRHEG